MNFNYQMQEVFAKHKFQNFIPHFDIQEAATEF